MEYKTVIHEKLSAGLIRIVLGSGQVSKEKELKRWFEKALERTYSSVWRKLNDDSAWDEADFERIANALGVSVESLMMSLACGGTRVVDADVDVGGIPIHARVVLGDPVGEKDDVELAAFEVNGEWRVKSYALASRHSPLYSVLGINLVDPNTRRCLVALVDDDRSITYTASELFKLDGIATKCFWNEESFLATLQNTRYDAYVLDWFLPSGPTGPDVDTSENLIRKIRASEHGASAPIFLVTGAGISDNPTVVDDLKRVARDYDCTPMMKPIRWEFLAEDLLKRVRKES